MKSIAKITELKKEQDGLLLKKAQIWDTRLWLEEVVLDAFQDVYESIVELNVVEKAKHFGAVITQLQ